MREAATEFTRGAIALDASHEILAGVQLRVLDGIGSIATPGEASVVELGKENPESELTLPATTLDYHVIRRLLETKNSTIPDDRIKNLLDYAWDSPSLVERPVPAELLPYLRIRPSEWYRQNQKRLEQILRVRDHKVHTDRYLAEDIEDETRKFNPTPFMRNAVIINKSVVWPRVEGFKVEFAARMMLFQADRAYHEELSSQA